LAEAELDIQLGADVIDRLLPETSARKKFRGDHTT